MKDTFYVYHVVTDRNMSLGQKIIFDDNNKSGVASRVSQKIKIVEDIYKNPQKYTIDNLDHHTKVAIRELALEEVRKDRFANLPSRLACLYVSETLEEAEKWCGCFVDWGRPTYRIVKLKIEGNKFKADACNCFTPTLNKQENLKLAERYWLNLPNCENTPPIYEILVGGYIEVVEIVKEINKNINAPNKD